MKTDDGQQLEHLATSVVDGAVGENLDQLAIMDMRGDGILRVLYRAARELQGERLSLGAGTRVCPLVWSDLEAWVSG